MMRLLFRAFLAIACLIGFTLPQDSGATALNTNVLVDGGAFYTWGDSGMTFEFSDSVAPLSLSQGDVLRSHIVFKTPIRLTDTGDGDWVVGPYSNREEIVVRYCFADQATGAHVDASSAIDIRGHGSLNVDSINMSISTSGACSELVWVFADDLTASSFVLNGLDIETTIDSLEYYQYGTNNLYASIFVGLAAGDLRYAVPEPGTLALVGLGLAGLAFTCRRKQ